MYVNIVCAVFNQKSAIKKTIESFALLKCNNKRLIIIDGGSDDGTVDVINEYKDVVDFFITEKDSGISDAFNKGVKQALPGYVYFLGAGDSFFGDEVISDVLLNCDYKDHLLVCGKVNYVDEVSGKVLLVTPKKIKFNKYSLLLRMSLPHQGLFTSTVFFERFGLFNLNCKYAMDYDLLLRAFNKFPHVIIKDIIVANWMTGGIGSNRTGEVLGEYNKIKIANKVAPVFVLKMINAFIFSKYHIKRMINYARCQA